MFSIRVLVADDQRLMREGIASLLKLQPGIEVVGTVANGEEALEQAAVLLPDVILMDIRMPVMDGVEATAEVHVRLPGCKVLMLTTFDDDEYVADALRAGASGYLLKDAINTDLLAAVRSVARGEGYLSPGVSEAVLSDYRRHVTDPIDLLSSREREVLQLIAEGKTNKEIAGILNLSVYTVDAHRGKIMEKLNLHSTGELVRFAVRKGLVD